MVLHLLPLPLPPALQLMRSITPPLPLQCRGIYGGFFGLMLTFAAKSLEHTANQLWQWAREPNLGVKSFANSISLDVTEYLHTIPGRITWQDKQSPGGIFFPCQVMQRKLQQQKTVQPLCFKNQRVKQSLRIC
jgi:hypothetical protein